MSSSAGDERSMVLERRLTRPKRVGLFGHRNVGKTTLLAMFYRQAAGGCLPGLRLAAANPRAAEYLGEKIAALEAGEPTAGTLAETELALTLYHGPARLELVVKDYQGEHITLGANQPILEFFADCDAILLCLDAAGSADSGERRKRQQEIEGLLERILAQSSGLEIERPLALVLTRMDLVPGFPVGGEPDAPWVEQLMESRYGMTRYALAAHAPRGAIFACSAFGPGASGIRPPGELRPIGLDGPLAWLAQELEAHDRRDFEQLWNLSRDPRQLERVTQAYEQRYPKSNRSFEFRQRLRGYQQKRRRLRIAQAAATVCLLALALACYDRLGYETTARLDRSNPTPAQAEHAWTRLITLHPTLAYFWPRLEHHARERLAFWQIRRAEDRLSSGSPPADLANTLERIRDEAPALTPEIQKVEAARERQRHDTRWSETAGEARSLAAMDDPARGLAAIDRFLREFPNTDRRAQALELANSLKQLLASREQARDQQLLDELIQAESAPGVKLADLIERARRFLTDRPASPARTEIQTRLAGYLRKQDDADFEAAADPGKNPPASPAARLAKLDQYLKIHAADGRHLSQAMETRDQILTQWDYQSYKLAYDHAVAQPDDLEITARMLQNYLHDHPDGRFADDARRWLDWWDKISVPHAYHITLRRGSVEPTVGKYLAGGAPDLGVVVEVAGQAYGPSSIIKDSHRPVWDYTFPDPIIWKTGDPITIRIIDYDWSATEVYRLTSPAGDPLAIRLLSGTIRPTKGGETSLTFASDYKEPTLPAPE